MKEWLLDTPVILKFFVRTETLRRTFDVIRKVRPRILFLAGDGPRNEADKEKIIECHKILENIDWECQVHRYYSEVNKGILRNDEEGIKSAFKLVDRLICVEDDMLCSESFFWFCQEMLEKYKDDMRVQMVCGQNLEGISESVSADYFFARRISSGCIGIWKSKYEYVDYSYPVFEDTYMTSLLEKNIPRNLKSAKHIERAKRDRKEYLQHPAPKSSEVAFTLNFYLNNWLNIIPKRNMTVSIGLSEDSAHAPDKLEKLPKGIRRVFELPLYDIEMPIKHPKYMICDVNYEKKWRRILAVGYPWVEAWRLVARFFLTLRYDGLAKTLKFSVEKMKMRLQKDSDING